MRIRITTMLLLFIYSNLSAFSQNPPEAGAIDTFTIYLGSGENHYLIPEVSDGDDGTQDMTITATSAGESIVKVLGVDYETGNRYAILKLEEQNLQGMVKIHLEISDTDGSITDDLIVNVIPYSNPGALFQIHDAVFWQEVVPLDAQPIYEQLIMTGEGPFDELNYEEIPLTVNAGCTGDICTGHDFYTAFYYGYIVPPATGEYTFYVQGANDYAMWLSPDTDHKHATQIIYRGDQQDNIGSAAGNNQYQSEPVVLQAGNVYAFYATQWIVHETYGGVLMEGPGVPKSFIPGNYMMPLYDTIAPTPPSDLKLMTKTSDKAVVSWTGSEENLRLAGYDLYINGVKYNDMPLTGTRAEVSGLDPATFYNINIKSVDEMGNESLVSGPLNFSTYPADAVSPTPPNILETLVATGISAKIKWSGASDETAVIGYNLYIADSLYNTEGVIYADTAVIRGLAPLTTYQVRIEAVDASYNISDLSRTFSFSTAEFDPLGENLGEKTARMVVYMNNISRNNGIGINGPYENGQMVNDSRVREVISQMEAGAIRWGALSANVKSFEGSTGPGKSNTYARMMDFANELDAYFALTVGVQSGLDYMTDPNTFLHLLEYLAGPAESTYGAIRASEGFTEPVLNENSKGIILEFGNEVWGGESHDAEIGANYSNYGEWCREMAALIKSSPYYDPEKIRMAYSLRNPHPGDSYGLTESAIRGDTGEIDVLAVSGYLGGNLDYDPDLPAWNSELQYHKQRIDQARRNIEGLKNHLQLAMELTGTIKKFYLYESNSTTPLYNGRLGQAMVMTDYFATGMPYGSIVPSVFHLTGGEWRITIPAQDYKPLPLYVTSRFFNHFCKGNVLETEIVTKGEIDDGSGRVIDYEPVGLHAYANGESYALLLISRDFENDYTVQVDLPDDFNYTRGAKMYVLSGESFSSYEISVDSSDVDLQDGYLVRVPKYGMVLIAFQGDDQNFEQTELGYFDHVKPESILIEPEDGEAITSSRERLYFNAHILPEDAFFKQIGWEVIENDAGADFKVYPGTPRMYVRGSGICGENGTIRVLAYSVEDSSVNAVRDIPVSNQGTDCNTGMDDAREKSLWYYPNPASGKIIIETGTAASCEVQIRDLSGRLILTSRVENSGNLDVSSLRAGIYIIRMNSLSSVKTSVFIKQ